MMLQINGFDYAVLDPVVAGEAKAVAERIRARMRSSFLDTGRDLIVMKQRLDHGQFGAWIKAEFDMTERTAQRFMGAAELVEQKPDIVSDLPQTVLYALAAPSTPPQIMDEMEAAAASGVPLPPSTIKEKVETARSEQRAEKKALARIAKRHPRRTRQEHLAIMEREAAAREKEREASKRDEEERSDRMRPLAEAMRVGLGDMLPQVLSALDDYYESKSLMRHLRVMVAEVSA